jgi:hypothetical protein
MSTITIGRINMVSKAIISICLVLLITGLAGCSNPHKQAARAATDASRAEKDVNEQKAKILEDYRKCLDKNKSDEKACAGYKKALDSM